MAHERLRPQFAFDEEKIKQLKQIAPECFEDGKINFEILRQNLGDWAQDEENKDLEHFGLFWPGKRDARRIASMPPQGTLKPVYGEGLKADGTPDTDGVNDSKNIFIEGDNLEVLKILQKSYAGKIKMIYIDPPYNTGNDFVYDDDFTEPIQEYLRRTSQIDEEGKPLTTNKRSDGRFHSKWLSMMYPRLRLARNLLKEDGFIFISIDDNEVHNLSLLMNEIFGEENSIGTFIWKKKAGGGDDSGQIAIEHEYIICYSKSIENIKLGKIQHESPSMTAKYNREENGRRYYLERLDKTSLTYSASMDYAIKSPDNTDIFPPQPNPKKRTSIWRWSKDKVESSKDQLEFQKEKKTGEWRIYTRTWESLDGVTPRSLLTESKHGRNRDGSQELAKLIGSKIFNNPKPQRLLRHLLEVADLKENDIILDFFSGSSSTAHAILDSNKEKGITRKYILVQLPEPCDEKSAAFAGGYKTIADISKERIRRVAQTITNSELDLGFNCFSLIESNYKKWSNYSETSISKLEENLDLFNQAPLKDGWTRAGFLSEIILIEGFVLSCAIKRQAQYKENEVQKVSDEYCEHSLLVCLDKEIKPETIDALEFSGNDIFICFDRAINNVDKLRLSDKGLIKTI